MGAPYLSLLLALCLLSLKCSAHITWRSDTPHKNAAVNTRTQFHSEHQPHVVEGELSGPHHQGHVHKCFQRCPLGPTDACDFIFDGHRSTLPEFNLTQVLIAPAGFDEQIRRADIMLRSGPGIVHYTGHWDSPIGGVATKVDVEKAGFEEFLGCVGKETKSLLHSDLNEAKESAAEILNRGADTWLQGSELAERSIGMMGEGRRKVLSRFERQCVKLPLQKMRLSVHVDVLGEKHHPIIMDLEKGDKHQQQVPDERRCVMFRTRV